MRTFGVVAAFPKRAPFQDLQGYIATRLERLSGRDKVLFSRHLNENTAITACPLEQNYQAILAQVAAHSFSKS
jgi:hypothetical protein